MVRSFWSRFSLFAAKKLSQKLWYMVWCMAYGICRFLWDTAGRPGVAFAEKRESPVAHSEDPTTASILGN